MFVARTLSFCKISYSSRFFSSSIKPILTETINGRTRFYYNDGKKLHWKWSSSNSKDQTSMTNIERFFPARIVQWFKEMFFPVGYPGTCHPVYAKVHYWQFFETMFGSLVGVLCSEAMLSSIGISTAASAGGAVAIQWVLKDGIGEVGKLFFIQQFAKSFDARPKTWKFFGEISCISGSALQLSTILVHDVWFLALASFGYMFRSIHFSIWSATHMTFTRNFALTGNVADVVAKDDSQMSVAHLLGLLTGVGLISISNTPAILISVFAILAPAHFYSTYSLLRATQFKVLNRATTILLCESWIVSKSIPDTKTITAQTRWFGESIKDPSIRINIGSTIRREFHGAGELEEALALYRNEKYLLNYNKHGVGIVFLQDASADDVIKGTLNAMKLSHSRDECTTTESYAWTRDNYIAFKEAASRAGWQTDAVFYGDKGHRASK